MVWPAVAPHRCCLTLVSKCSGLAQSVLDFASACDVDGPEAPTVTDLITELHRRMCRCTVQGVSVSGAGVQPSEDARMVPPISSSSRLFGVGSSTDCWMAVLLRRMMEDIGDEGTPKTMHTAMFS